MDLRLARLRRAVLRVGLPCRTGAGVNVHTEEVAVLHAGSRAPTDPGGSPSIANTSGP
jgi:hypothetical protein